MRQRVCLALIVILLIFAPAGAEAGCPESAQVAHSAVSIMKHFDAEEAAAQPGLVGIRGTGWFLTPTRIVTVEHVATAMHLSHQDWKPLEIVDRDTSRSVSARIHRLAGLHSEKLAVLDLQRAVSGARSLAVRRAPLAPEERVVTLADPMRHLQYVDGRFVQIGDDERLAGAALLEMYDGGDRLAVDHGASGAPVLDCEGRVAAVVSHVITQTLTMVSREIRVSTAWGTPNVVSVPIQVLDESFRAE